MEAKGKKGLWRKIDRLLLGVIIGGAVGSILGLTLSPKSGRETRADIRRKTEEIGERVSCTLGNIVKKKHGEKGGGFWHFLHQIFYRKK